VGEQRIAICRVLHRLGADIAARAAAILHRHRLPQQGFKLRRQGARDHIRGTAGRKRHNDPDRAFRPGGVGQAWRGQKAGCSKKGRAAANGAVLHHFPPAFSCIPQRAPPGKPA